MSSFRISTESFSGVIPEINLKDSPRISLGVAHAIPGEGPLRIPLEDPPGAPLEALQEFLQKLHQDFF